MSPRLRPLLGLLFGLLLVLPVALASTARAEGPPPVARGERTLGRADAPVTVIEYGSLVCPHCATWEISHFATLKANYIDTGRVRFVFRDMLTEPADAAATAAAITRCAAPTHTWDVIHTMYVWQGTARNFGPMSAWFDRGIKASGRDKATMEACVRDPATFAAIRADMQAGAAAGVQGTPTFFVNGRRQADASYESLTAAIDAASPGR